MERGDRKSRGRGEGRRGEEGREEGRGHTHVGYWVLST